jgi:glycosyltransferase involved in cell wall biosynthesis
MNGSGEIKFSLVMCTVNRTREVERCIVSLEAQNHRNFELLIVDQNVDSCMADVVARHAGKIEIKHLRSPLGCSRARNVGIATMSGEVLAFPDDDCVYPPNLLERVASFLATHPDWDGLTGSVTGSNHWSSKKGPVTRYRVWWQGVDFTMFFRRKTVDSVGRLDERLGPGSGTPWGAAEGTDYLLRAIAKGYRIWYDPDLRIDHPGPIDNHEEMAKEIRKALTYSMGVGHVIQQHHYPAWYAGYMAARPIAGATISLLKFQPQRAKLYWNVLRGFTRGYLSKDA